MKEVINTPDAPEAIGTYSQAIKSGNTLYLSGQIPLVPETMEMVSDDFEAQAVQVFKNLGAVLEAAGSSFADVVKLNVYLTDLSQFALVNDIMARYVSTPYPARAAVQVAALPRGAQIEIDGVADIFGMN